MGFIILKAKSPLGPHGPRDSGLSIIVRPRFLGHPAVAGPKEGEGAVGMRRGQMSTQTHPCLNQAGVGWWLTFEFARNGVFGGVGGPGGTNLTSAGAQPGRPWLCLRNQRKFSHVESTSELVKDVMIMLIFCL